MKKNWKANCTNCYNFVCGYQGMKIYNDVHCDCWLSKNKYKKEVKDETKNAQSKILDALG